MKEFWKNWNWIFRPWSGEFWKILSGTRVYRDQRHWLNQCVGVRLMMAFAAAFVSLSIVYEIGGTGIGFVSRDAMLLILLLVNSFFCIFLSFGSGRNYERTCALCETKIKADEGHP